MGALDPVFSGSEAAYPVLPGQPADEPPSAVFIVAISHSTGILAKTPAFSEPDTNARTVIYAAIFQTFLCARPQII